MTTDEKFDFLAEKFDLLVEKFDLLDEKINLLTEDVSTLKQDVSALKQSNLQTQMALENTVNKCIQALGEGFQLNAERLDRFNLESIKNQSELSYLLAKATNEKVDKLIEQLRKTA